MRNKKLSTKKRMEFLKKGTKNIPPAGCFEKEQLRKFIY